MSRVIGIAFSRCVGWAESGPGGFSSGVLELADLDPAAAVTAFLAFWDSHRCGSSRTVAVVWPERLPLKFAGLFEYLRRQANVRAVTPAMLKSRCGGASVTVADVILAAQELHPEADSFERAFSVLAAGLAADSLAD